MNRRRVACVCDVIQVFQTTSYFGEILLFGDGGQVFDVRLIPEFSGAVTAMPIVEWVENVELVCELCTMKNVEHVLPLRLQGGALSTGNLAQSRKRMRNRSSRPS